MSPRLAGRIVAIQRRGTKDTQEWSLQVDGEDFPWLISSAGVTTTVNDAGIPSITIELLADEVMTINDWSSGRAKQ